MRLGVDYGYRKIEWSGFATGNIGKPDVILAKWNTRVKTRKNPHLSSCKRSISRFKLNAKVAPITHRHYISKNFY